MKSGANFKDQNAIRRLAAEGKSDDEISRELQIEVKVVASFTALPEVEEDDKQPLASDAAVKLADESDVDLNLVTGAGANGNITKSDVEAYIAARDEGNE